MIKVKKFIATHRLVICLAIVHWFITTLFQLDRLFFQYEAENKTMLVVKIVYFFALIAIYSYCAVGYEKYKINKNYFEGKIKIFLIHLSMLLVLLLILWPGTWAWDDIWILNNAQQYKLTPWQHIFSGFWHILCLQFIPTPGGIIFIQLIVAAVCITYIVTKVQDMIFASFRYDTLEIRRVLFLLPFFLPPVLMYLYSGYRIGLYIFLEATLLISLISLKYDKECTIQKLSIITVLTIVVSSWRTESFIYVLISSMAILMMKNNICKKEKAIAVVLLGIMFVGVTVAQEKMLHSDNYKIISTLRPVAELVKVADKDIDRNELIAIDKVINLSTIYKNPGANGESLYWAHHVVRNEYTRQDYKDYIKSAINLSYKYPLVVFHERIRVLMASSSMNNIATNNTYGARTLFYKKKLGNMTDGSKQYFQRLQAPASKPVFMKMREKVIRLLGCMKSNFSLYPIYKLIWNHLLPTCFIIFFYIYQLFKKNYWVCSILLGLILKWPIIFFTSPSDWFMYYLSFYLIGYMILIYSLLYIYLKFQHKGAETHES